MKILKLDAHDRLEHLLKDQSDVIAQGCDDCLKKNPKSIAIQSRMPYVYIFAFAKTADNGVDKRMLWQPRLTKPEAQTNSMLFRAKSHGDVLEICWNIPDDRLWAQYQKGNMLQNAIVCWSIHQFLNNRKGLEDPHPDDLSFERLRHIREDIRESEKQQKKIDKMYAKPETEGASETLPFSKL